MILERLSLANYRGFEQIDIDFEKDVTLIAGVNGVGKSALLSAIVKCASRALPKITPSRENALTTVITDVKADKKLLSISAQFKISKADVYVDISRSIEVSTKEAKELTKRLEMLRFAIRQTSKGSREQRLIENDIKIIESKLAPVAELPTVRILYANPDHSQAEMIEGIRRTSTLPLAVFYSTSRFLSRLPTKLPKTKNVEIATAYGNALEQLEISLNDFANWYRYQLEGKSMELTKRIFQQLNSAITTFLPDVSDLQLHDDHFPRFSVQKNGDRFFVEQLSDGERGLLALVLDLTRRLASANPDSDNPIIEGVALVLIDEIELHLHPKWQRQVIRRLQEVFKKCQFVITTHSPQVIGQIKAKKLRLLSLDESGKVVLQPVSQAFGMDSSWILQNIMGVPARDYETEQKLSKVYDAIDADDYKEARRQAEKLRSEIGDFPDLQEALAMLDRFEMLGQG